MKFNLIKKVIRKSFSVMGIKPNAGVIIKSSKWIKKESCNYEKQTKRKLRISIETNADKRTAYPNMSRAIECAINDISKKGENTFKNILVIKNPYQYSPLCALALFKTKKSCGVRVTVRGKTSDCDISYTIPNAKTHRVPIMGLYADYENTIIIELLQLNGKTLKSKTFQMYVGALKGKSSQIKVTKSVSKTEYLYGLTLVYGGDDGVYPYSFDRNGDIRFAFAKAPKTYGFQPISKGRFLFLNKSVTRLTCTNPTSTQMLEVDQMGRCHTIYNVKKGAHHDFVELEDGNLVVGSNAIQGVTFEDAIIELDRKTGKVVNEIILKDYIDAKYINTSDWAHLNSIEYNKAEKTVMINLRNLHTVMKIDYEKKQVIWVLGHPTFWKGSIIEDKVLIPQGDDMRWFFQAHATYSIYNDLDGNPETKHIIIYDNHIQKRAPVSYFDGEKKSYVLIYEINENQHTVGLFKSFEFPLSNIRSNGILEKEAGRVFAMNGKLMRSTDKERASIIEFDYETGDILNKFSMYTRFYRAYEFKFEPAEMAKPMNLSSDYCLGNVYAIESCPQISTDKAKELPEPILEEGYKTEEDRKVRLQKIVEKNPKYYIDPEQDMSRIKVTIEEDTLYVTLLDHLLEKIYLIGKRNTYCRDFTDTKQERPAFFSRTGNTDAIPLKDLKEDTYEIFYKHNIGLYKSGYKFSIKIK